MLDSKAPAVLLDPLCPACHGSRDARYGDTNERLCHRCRSSSGKVAELHLAIGLAESGDTAGPHHPVEEPTWRRVRRQLIEQKPKLKSDVDRLDWLIDRAMERIPCTRNEAMEMSLAELPSLARKALVANDAPKQQSLESRALASLHERPGITDAERAAELGCARGSLYRIESYKNAKAILKSSLENLPRGSKYNGRVEALDGDE